METVDVFRRIDRHQYSFGVDLFRQRKLHEDAVDVIAAIQIFDEFQEVFGTAKIGPDDLFREKAERLAGFYFAANVDLGSRMIADENGGESGTKAVGAQSLDFGGDFGLDLACDPSAVEQDG